MVNPRNPQSVVPTHPPPSDQHILQEATYGSKEKKRRKNFGHQSSRTSDHSKLNIQRIEFKPQLHQWEHDQCEVLLSHSVVAQPVHEPEPINESFHTRVGDPKIHWILVALKFHELEGKKTSFRCYAAKSYNHKWWLLALGISNEETWLFPPFIPSAGGKKNRQKW